MGKRLVVDVVDIASDIIKIPSFTPLNEEKFKACDECIDYVNEAFIKLGAKTEKLVFEGHDSIKAAAHPVPNLLAKIEIGNPKVLNHKSICYLGHIDVVGVQDENLWSHKPFSGKVEDGYVHGRGATDMKGSVAAFISAMDKMKQQTTDMNMTVYAVISGDEEWYAVNGTDKVLEEMKRRKIKVDAFLVGEPSSQDYLGEGIKIGRRGSLTGVLAVEGISGHVANEGAINNPIYALNSAILLLKRKKWRDGNACFPSTNLEVVNLDSGTFGVGTNVSPAQARANYNIRFTHKQTPEGLLRELKETIINAPKFLRNLQGYDFLRANVDEIVKANIASASDGYYSKPGVMAEAIRSAVQERLEIEAKFDGKGGNTDGRFVHKYYPKAEIVEFGDASRGGIVKGVRPKNYGFEGGMHQVNERASVENLYNLSELYVDTVVNYSKMRDTKCLKLGKSKQRI